MPKCVIVNNKVIDVRYVKKNADDVRMFSVELVDRNPSKGSGEQVTIIGILIKMHQYYVATCYGECKIRTQGGFTNRDVATEFILQSKGLKNRYK